MPMSSEDAVVQQLVRLGESYDSVRAMVLTSSRADPDAPRDILSDYDVILYTVDLAPFLERDDWFESLGPVLVTIRPGFQEMGRWLATRLVLYEDGTKIDFGLRRMDDLQGLCSTGSPPDDHGYTVLLDKDGLTASLGRPTHKAYIPNVPMESEYASVVNDFWWDSTYVSRYLWREDLMAVKIMLDHVLKQDELRTMLEWSVEIERGWVWKPGAYGRGLTKVLDPDTSRELVATYVGGDTEELWESLFRTAALFRRVAIRVADSLGYGYPHGLDDRVMIYHRTLRTLDQRAAAEGDLARLLRDGYSEYRAGT